MFKKCIYFTHSLMYNLPFQLVNSLCLRLFGYYRSEGVESKVFVLQFVPSLVYSYLSAIAQGDRKVRCIDKISQLIFQFNLI